MPVTTIKPTKGESSPSEGHLEGHKEDIAADENAGYGFDDSDSAIAACNVSSSASLSSSIYKYRYENGRSYHAYKDGSYLFPNDKAEEERLDIQHYAFLRTYDEELCICPAASEGGFRRVMDIGTGTGVWAVDFADAYPDCEVVGVDLSPIQADFVPPNVSFFIDDVEETWTYSRQFDFIHCRMMAGAIKDWSRFFEICSENLEPGGWIELSDIMFPVKFQDQSLPQDQSRIYKWSNLMLEASKRFGQPLDSATQHAEHLQAAGFGNVERRDFKWPINVWPKDPYYKAIGEATFANIAENLEGLSSAYFTRVLGWSYEDMMMFLTEVRNEMKNTKVHAYFEIVTYIAQKPAEAPTPRLG